MSDTPLQVIQYGVEGDTTPGTAVPATRRLAGGKVAWTAIDENYNPQHPVGVYMINPTDPVTLMRGVELSFDGDLNIEEMVDFLEMGVKELAAPSGAGPYTWLFDPSESGANDPRSYTFERRLTEGVSPADIEAAFVPMKSLKMQVEWNGLADAERTAARANNRRLVRLRGIPSAGLEVRFDMVMRHSKGDFLTVTDADGNDVTEFDMVSAYDPAPGAGDPN